MGGSIHLLEFGAVFRTAKNWRYFKKAGRQSISRKSQNPQNLSIQNYLAGPMMSPITALWLDYIALPLNLLTQNEVWVVVLDC